MVQTPAGTPSDRHLIRHGEGRATGKYMLVLLSSAVCRFRRSSAGGYTRVCVFSVLLHSSVGHWALTRRWSRRGWWLGGRVVVGWEGGCLRSEVNEPHQREVLHRGQNLFSFQFLRSLIYQVFQNIIPLTEANDSI